MSDQKRRVMQNAREAAQKQLAGGGLSHLRVPAGVKFYKPKVGLMLLDILPYKTGSLNRNADAGRYHHELEVYTHRKVGASGETVLCLAKNLNKPCPVCEYRAQLEKQGDTDKETLNALYPKRRQLFWVVDRKDLASGAQLWEFPFASFGKLLSSRLDNDRADQKGWTGFADPESGMSLEVDFEEKSMGSNKYLNARSIDFVERKKQYTWDWMDENCTSLEEMCHFHTYDQLKELVEGGDEADNNGDAPAAAAASRGRLAPDEQADDLPPSRKRPAPAATDDGWDEPPPASRKKEAAVDAEVDPDAPPARKRPAPVDDELPPTRKRPAPVEDEEPAPATRKRPPAALAEDEPARKPAARQAPAADEWDDEPVAPKKRTPAALED